MFVQPSEEAQVTGPNVERASLFPCTSLSSSTLIRQMLQFSINVHMISFPMSLPSLCDTGALP